jgi:anthranilate phosphoribosyltransferase
MVKQFKNYLGSLLKGENLSSSEMESLMTLIMTGELSSAQIASCIVAMQIKGETPDEIAAAALVMREHSNKVKVKDSQYLIDTCGTGGDSLQTFNVSTISAIVSAAAGAKVAKHGGRSVSSKCGSADVLEALGVNVNLDHKLLGMLVDDIGIGFMFAPNYHPAMKYVAPVRKELEIRTMFNLLGPLTNPASAKRQIVGVYSKELTMTFAKVLQKLGSEHVLVVHGEDGMDEISITGRTFVAELKDNIIKEYIIEPSLFNLKSGTLKDIVVEDSSNSKKIILDILNGELSVARDITLLNAGAAIYIAGLADNINSGIKIAEDVIDQGKAMEKLNQLKASSNLDG